MIPNSPTEIQSVTSGAERTMEGISTRLVSGLINLWCATGPWSSSVTPLFFVTLIVICASCAFIGAVPTFVYGHDDFFLLENGWRALNGLRPHIDFWSPWGPLTFLVTALGLRLSHASANGIAYGNSIFALLVGLWTYRVSRDRLQQTPRALVALYASALACAPYPVGMAPMALSHAMTYNRYGYALLVPLLVECVQRRDKTATDAEEWLGGISTGAAVALALFLKASYFIVGLGFLVASLLFWIPGVRRFFGVLAGFSVVTFLGLAYLRFNLAAMLRGLHMAAGARAQSFSLITPVYNVAMHLVPLYCVLGLTIVATFMKPRCADVSKQSYLPVAAIIVYFADIALLSTNAQSAGLPLLGAFAIIVANQVADAKKNSPSSAQLFTLPYYASVLLISGLLFLPQFTSDIVALPIAAARKIHPPPGCATRFTETGVSDLMLCDRPDGDPAQRWSNGSNYTAYVDDGVALLRTCCKPTDKVLVMDMQNPFPYVLRWVPPRGGLAATAFNYTLSDRFRPSIDEYFGDATVVMIPKHPAFLRQHSEGFYKIYGPAVEERFRLIAESDWFWLYKRQ